MMLAERSVHPWLKTIRVVFAPGPTTPLLETTAAGILDCFRRLGHTVQARPNRTTGLILTTAAFGRPVGWREALMFIARRRWRLAHTPAVFTLIQAHPGELQSLLVRFETALAKVPADPADFTFPGLAAQAHRTLAEQGSRGGPLLSLLRLLQAQAKCIRVMLVVGEDRPCGAYLFDLVGAHPWLDAGDLPSFYLDTVLRMVTTVSTREVTRHETVGDPIPRACWDSLSTPAAMLAASRELAQRRFFTRMVRVNDLIQAPALSDAIKNQYSEGCFATWDPGLEALIATVTGSARPVEKENLAQDDLTVIAGVRPDRLGAQVRQVEGKRNDPPSSEAVEMICLDEPLPRIALGDEWPGISGRHVPVVRSKLHGHRGVTAYDRRRVEHVWLDAPFYDYPVSCGSNAQALGLQTAFSRAEALRNPADPRQVAFAILPGHGTVVVEKWRPGKTPFQLIWEYMDAGYLEVSSYIPQGRMSFVPGPDGRMTLRNEELVLDFAAAART